MTAAGTSEHLATGRLRPILLKNTLFAWRLLGRWRGCQSTGEENETGERR